ncbi:tyrosine-type recombinase/integrase [Scandinavium manionii]|uniref:tyrosine-type recombinase/integrase n=1 Tax=Scandinavium manionii TaxID=2926520 RepID=UPI0021652FB6|nr:integrase arm-type DNA-binding domain-containing protein [Scandinavium manionii]MCS2150767.1 tyrosine-type recombinase/integrase [Scandinavium manionii]MCS2166988.1 tyrosine-type recombinase/integrase [Scandinavium manionii]
MLTNAHIKNATPKEREYTITDGGGLAILIKPNGSKLWRFRYTLNGKKQKLSIGVYPDVTLSTARIQAANARAKVAQGISPVDEKAKEIEANRSGSSFRDVYGEWYQSRIARWADSYAKNITRLFDNHILPSIGGRSVAKIEPPDVLKLLKKIEAKGSKTVASNARSRCSEVFAFAVITGKAKYNPARDLTGALQRHKKGHFASLDASEIGSFLNVLTTSGESLIVISLIRLLMLTGLRPTEAREGAWNEVDLDAALWRMPAERMKGDRPHIVPLSRQAIDILKFMRSITGPHGLIFPNQRDALRAMSPGLVGNLIHRCGYGNEATGHGFRHTMSTILHEQGYNTAWIEAQLAHADKNTIRSTYNHAQYLDNRREMLQWYADHIDELHRAATSLSVNAGDSHGY